MAEYLKVRWHHDSADEPVILLSELVGGWEVRKVERYRDGRVQRAGRGESMGDTRLSEERMPSAVEIAEDPQFIVEPTNANEFEAEWQISGRR
jgi:hypothetical protein